MAIDKDAIREHIRGILIALGDDPDREGLKETPDRVARMYEEVFEEVRVLLVQSVRRRTALRNQSGGALL